MKNKYIASYDFGTSGVKAVLVTEAGSVRSYATASYPLLTPRAGWAEQEPDAYWRSVCQATHHALVAGNVVPEEVVGVVFGTMWKGIIPIDKDGNVLHNCMIWLDARAEKQAKVLNKRMNADRFCAQDYWARLMWLRDEHPEIYEATDCILENNSYLKFKSTGKKGVDLTNCLVSSPKSDLERDYAAIMAAAELDMDKFPPIMMPWETQGGLTVQAAREMGLCEGTPVFGGCGDIPAITIGSGSSGIGAAHIYLGSSGWRGITASQRKEGVGEVYQSLDREKEILLYTMQSACMSFDWTIHQFYHAEWKELGGKVYDLVNRDIADVPPGSGGLLATSWIHGERPPLSEKARGVFFNIDASHDRRYIVNAMQESICYMLRWKLEAYRCETGKDIPMLRLVGGGTGSEHWMQMLSDILQLPIEVPADSRHAGAIGTAYCALIGLGMCNDFENANRMVRVEKRYEPRRDHTAVYEKMYLLFQSLYPTLEEMYWDLNG